MAESMDPDVQDELQAMSGKQKPKESTFGTNRAFNSEQFISKSYSYRCDDVILTEYLTPFSRSRRHKTGQIVASNDCGRKFWCANKHPPE